MSAAMAGAEAIAASALMVRAIFYISDPCFDSPQGIIGVFQRLLPERHTPGRNEPGWLRHIYTIERPHPRRHDLRGLRLRRYFQAAPAGAPFQHHPARGCKDLICG